MIKQFVTAGLMLIAAAFFLTDCNTPGGKQPDHAATDSTFLKGLQEKQLGESGYFLSIPANYTIKLHEGPDFDVYYFSLGDTAIAPEFSGGIYFGNHSNELEPDNDSCKVETVRGRILSRVEDWKVYTCKDWITVQTLMTNKSSEGWNEEIHAFGGANSRENLSKVMMIYATMRKKK